MLRIVQNPGQMKYGELMTVYEECIHNAADEVYPHMDRNEALFLAEQEYYTYMCDCFFRTPGAYLAMWEVNSRCVSAVRIEPYEDGVILAGLETAPAHRGMGYAKQLVSAVLQRSHGNVYSHVHRQNHISLAVHLSCGFIIKYNQCVFLDGTNSNEHLTLKYGRIEKVVDK